MMLRTTSRLSGWLTAGALAISLAAVPLGAAEARGFGGGGGMHGGFGGMHGGGFGGGGSPWIHGGWNGGGWNGGGWNGGGWNGGGWNGGGGWHGGGWDHGWHGHYGHYGYGYGYGPFLGGLAAGALLSPYAYGGDYYDDYGPYCRTVLSPRGTAHHRYYVRREVCS